MNIWQQVLGLAKIGIHDNFFTLGGDSIQSIQAVAGAAKLGLYFTTRQLFEFQTIAELAPHASRVAALQIDQGAVQGGFVPLPVQAEFLHHHPSRHHYNQSVMVKLPRALSHEELMLMLKAIVKRHDGLRLKFAADNRACFVPADELDLATNIAWFECPSLEASGIETIANQVQTGLNIETGPLFKWAQFHVPEGSRLLWVMHHLLVDGISWRILLNDLQQSWQALAQGQAPSLAAKTTSLSQWSEYLNEWAQSDTLVAEAPFWHSQLEIVPLPLAESRGEPARQESLSVSCDASLTRSLLVDALQPYRLTINELLLAALSLTFSRWGHPHALSVLVEGHGREHLTDKLDISETVGWFTSKYPVVLESTPHDLHQHISQVKELCRSIPNKGIGFGVLDAFNEKVVFSQQRPQIVFNYLGQFETQNSQVLALANEPCGMNIGEVDFSKHPIIFNGLVGQGQLRFDLLFDATRLPNEDAQEILRHLKVSLQDIVSFCLSDVAGGLTPTDFPLAKVTLEEVATLESRYAIEDLYPATGMQSGLLFHSELLPQAYVNQVMLTLQGLDTEKFLQCWLQLIERHDILRTAFVMTDAGYHQLVTKPALQFQLIDLSNMESTSVQTEIKKARKQDLRQGFELDQAPLMRMTLFKLPSHQHVLLWSHHHALWDGWCNSLLFKSVMQLYSGRDLLEKVPQFKGYVNWLNQQDVNAAEKHWQAQLSGVELTPLCNRSRIQEPSDTHFSYQLDYETTEYLAAFARAHKCTLNTLLQGAWAYVLHRYTGAQKVTFGAVTSGRSAAVDGIENAIGLFINTLPVVVDFSVEKKMPDYIQSLFKQSMDAEVHGYVPLQRIQQLAGGGELFDSVLIFENYPFDETTIDDANAQQLNIVGVETYEQTHYGVSLVIHQKNHLQLQLQVQEGVYAQDMVAGMLPDLASVLLAFLDEGTVTTRTLPLHCDRAALTPVDVPQKASTMYMHQRFEEQVAMAPDATALICDGQSLTYQQLDQRANQLAHHLRSLGLKTGDLVGISVERNMEMMVGILAILKAGAAYLPLDPDFPQKRLAYMIEDSGIGLVLVQPELARAIGENANVSYVDIADQAIWVNLQGYPVTLPDAAEIRNTAQLAYMMYTSGSTGKPKGVLIEHGSVSNFLHAMNERLDQPFSADCRLLAVTTAAFDISVFELFGPLSFGGAVILATSEQRKDPCHLTTLMDEQKISCMQATPSSWQMLLDIDWAGKADLLALSGGEPLSAIRAAHLVRRCARLFNCYGPTEATIWSLVSQVSEQDCEHEIMLQGSLAHYWHILLDSFMRPVPKGTAGELCIYGAGLARGYFNRTSLTEEKFRRAPGNLALCERLYRTGDLVRQLGEDAFEFLGRTDGQVKIRGHRIELGEIEHELCQSQFVNSAVVTSYQTEGRVQLLAYVQTVEGKLLEQHLHSLQLLLQQSLPAYMQPSAIIPIESWPKTPNGKVDKRALALPQHSAFYGIRVAPESDTEVLIVNTIAKLLNSDPNDISVEADFFQLGGDSMLAVQLIHRLEQSLAIKPSLAWVYQNSRVRQLAAHIDRLTTMQLLAASQEALEKDDVEEFSL